MLTISSAYNYERDASGDCKLVAGLTLPEASAVCKDKNVKEYYTDVRFRRIPLSTCEGGQEFDKTGDPHPCPGFE